ncbi:ABC transporter ATP-binding protein [Acidithiobacillus sp. IBUN Pt1247-S3]|uniref:ABC transporter ATP-binding protein n=1 Tax=Acidithiobacillus sp. IBUN Pt1247-S3 TaxID=3166642 RepID=UPI0034E50088
MSLRLHGVGKRQPDAPECWLFEHIDLQLEAGDFVAIRGESGLGKSTLLHLIAGLERKDAGSVQLCGQDVDALNDDARTLLRRRQIGFVFQSFHLLPQLSARENIALPWRLNALPRRELRDRLEALAEQLGITQRLDALPRELSGGEQQRVAVARALIHGPALVLADEPTGSLDPERAGDVLALLGQLGTAAGAAVLMVTHSEAAAAIAQRRLEMRRDGLH